MNIKKRTKSNKQSQPQANHPDNPPPTQKLTITKDEPKNNTHQNQIKKHNKPHTSLSAFISCSTLYILPFLLFSFKELSDSRLRQLSTWGVYNKIQGLNQFRYYLVPLAPDFPLTNSH